MMITLIDGKFVVKQWHLSAGDELEWSFEVSNEDDQLVLVGRKVKPSKK